MIKMGFAESCGNGLTLFMEILFNTNLSGFLSHSKRFTMILKRYIFYCEENLITCFLKIIKKQSEEINIIQEASIIQGPNIVQEA